MKGGHTVFLENQNLRSESQLFEGFFVVVCKKNMFCFTLTCGDVIVVLCTYFDDLFFMLAVLHSNNMLIARYQYPNNPCMVYFPTFTIKINQM